MCTLLSIAGKLDYSIDIMDVEGTYLNGELAKKIYMQQLPGYGNDAGRVLQLKPSLYKSNQSGNIWNKKLNKAFLDLRFT